MTLEPVAAYERIAPEYSQLMAARRAYLEAVERVIVGEVGNGARCLLDVGAGDGSRSVRIGEACGIERLVLLEPCAGMRLGWPTGIERWDIRAEELGDKRGEFDVILCLWNVLGHIFPGERRSEVLREFGRLLAAGGRVFIDVQHRYNARNYGTFPTLLRLLRDWVFPDVQNGDVVARWEVGGIQCATAGHVFTDSEFRGLLRGAGLRIEKRFVIDYASGESRRWSFGGNLLYVLRQA